jgi:hypothetical protein
MTDPMRTATHMVASWLDGHSPMLLRDESAKRRTAAHGAAASSTTTSVDGVPPLPWGASTIARLETEIAEAKPMMEEAWNHVGTTLTSMTDASRVQQDVRGATKHMYALPKYYEAAARAKLEDAVEGVLAHVRDHLAAADMAHHSSVDARAGIHEELCAWFAEHLQPFFHDATEELGKHLEALSQGVPEEHLALAAPGAMEGRLLSHEALSEEQVQQHVVLCAALPARKLVTQLLEGMERLSAVRADTVVQWQDVLPDLLHQVQDVARTSAKLQQVLRVVRPALDRAPARFPPTQLQQGVPSEWLHMDPDARLVLREALEEELAQADGEDWGITAQLEHQLQQLQAIDDYYLAQDVYASMVEETEAMAADMHAVVQAVQGTVLWLDECTSTWLPDIRAWMEHHRRSCSVLDTHSAHADQTVWNTFGQSMAVLRDALCEELRGVHMHFVDRAQRTRDTLHAILLSKWQCARDDARIHAIQNALQAMQMAVMETAVSIMQCMIVSHAVALRQRIQEEQGGGVAGVVAEHSVLYGRYVPPASAAPSAGAELTTAASALP